MIAVFAVVLFLALAIAASGIISLYADREVLTERDAGPLIAPTMFAVATAALYALLVSFGRRRGSVLAASVITAVITYFFFLVSGAPAAVSALLRGECGRSLRGRRRRDRFRRGSLLLPVALLPG
jgi:hypothetical protein